jgi:4-hydroxybenzoate polyprenyltransferase
MKSILHWIFYGNVFIALCAVCMTLETYLILGIPVNYESTFPLLIIVFCSTFFIYNIDLFAAVGDPSHEITADRSGWRIRYRTIINAVNACLGFLILVLSFFSSVKAFLFFLHLAVISLAYYFSFEIGTAKITPLRRIPFLKAFVITYVWAGSSVFLPALRNEIGLGSSEVLQLFIERYLFLFALTVIFDIRDLSFDVQHIRTIPGRFGSSKTKMLSLVLLLIACLLVCIHYQDPYLISAFILSFLIAAVLIYMARPDSGEYYFLFFVDGAMALQFFLVFLSLSKKTLP